MEGPLDVIQLHQAGLDHAVAALGTAMEKALHRAASGGQAEGGGDLIGGPIEITATFGHDHQWTQR